MVVYKWLVWTVVDAKDAPSILIHFIDMFLFTKSSVNIYLYEGQQNVQLALVIVAVVCIPVLLLGDPICLYIQHKRKKRHSLQLNQHAENDGDNGPLLVEDPPQAESEEYEEHQKNMAKDAKAHGEEFDASEVFMHQMIHTIEYCLGCISNTASYLRLWALSLAHAQLSEVLWNMVMRIGFSNVSYVWSIVIFVIFTFFAVLTVAILLIMEGLSAFLHALRLHWVEFQNKFYTGTGYKLTPFHFDSFY
ncbi:V-type proton ATPase 116 kDa subunit a-like [Pelobates cultripes]|uniref:V-type proton ATPase subunit a n=1 Tax=Pelobates cultripes TaxID=61616 RepID=A0AAD1WNA5_PELCU|nr:V-type proton ATPase 116 kDa subunit a-like [Pelobates cultripes]